MLHSMTAYGHAKQDIETGECVCEIRTVNHRYLDISFRMDDSLRGIEALIRERIAAKLSRGKVEVALRFNKAALSGAMLAVNDKLLDELISLCNEKSAQCSHYASIDMVRLMQWPGIVTQSQPVDQQSIDQILSVFDRSLHDLVATRVREGEQIRYALEERGMQLQSIVATLREHRPKVVVRQREKLVSKLQQLPIEADPGRLEQELVFTAQRLDIDEELDRLDTHIQEMFQVFKRTEAVGKRLDFLMQEFNREANTVASKSNDAATTAESVNMKVLIEQMREQVQNVE